MKRSIITVVVATFCGALTGISPLQSRELPAPPKAEVSDGTDPTSFRRQFSGAIADINREARTLIVEDQSLGRQTLHFDGRTRILQGDKTATPSEFYVGATVDGICIGAPQQAYAETIYLGR